MEDEKFVLNFGSCTVVLQGVDRENLTHLSAKCTGLGSSVVIQGIAMIEQLFCWRDCLKKMYAELDGSCDFSIADPGFSILIKCQKLGQLDVAIDISGNLIGESHLFKYEIDQSYLPAIIQTLLAFLESPPKTGSFQQSDDSDFQKLILG